MFLVTIPFSLFVCFKVSPTQRGSNWDVDTKGKWTPRWRGGEGGPLFALSISDNILAPARMFFQECAQVVQEYERAVIFRIGRLLPGGAKGPGLNISLFSKYFQLKEWQFSFQTRIK